MTKQIKKIDEEHIALIETTTNESLIAKKTLEEAIKVKQKELDELNDMLTYFTK